MDQKLQVLLSSSYQEWHTPKVYIEAARAVMGRIDLDPASSYQANETVQATVYYTPEYPANGALSVSWNGKIWCNPPYGKAPNGKSNQELFSKKLIEEYKKGNVIEAILLVNFVPGYKWFNPLWEYPMCAVNHTIKFIRADGAKAGAAKASSSFIYFGNNETLFYQMFSQFGYVGKFFRHNAA